MSDETKASSTWGVLNQEHPEYAADIWDELDVLGEGGYALTKRERIKLLPKKINEKLEVYQSRLEAAAYIGYLGHICNFYSTALFQKGLAISPAEGSVHDAAWSEFFNDADRRGNSLNAIVRDAMYGGMLKKRLIVSVDMPKAPDGVELTSKYDEERLKLNSPYCFTVPPQQLINWQFSADGMIDWAVLRYSVSGQDGPLAKRTKPVTEFKVWSRVVDNGRPVAAWAKFRCKALRDGEKHGDNDIVPMHSWGVTAFSMVPLVVHDMPRHLWIGNHVGPLNKEHFQRRSSLVQAEDRNLFPIPYFRKGPQIGGVGEMIYADVAQDQQRHKRARGDASNDGFAELSTGDEIDFAQPDTAGYKQVDGELKDLVDEMHRITHLMAQGVKATSTGLGRSGHSKKEDRKATETVLTAFGAEGRAVAERIYDIAASGRGESVNWSVSGLDNFQLGDSETSAEDARSLEEIDIDSPTFRIEKRVRVASAELGNAGPELLAKIRAEIEEAESGTKGDGPKTVKPGKKPAKDGSKSSPDDEGSLPTSPEALTPAR